MGRSASSPASCGTFSSSTMMVMMIARTPSLNAASRSVPMYSQYMDPNNPSSFDTTLARLQLEAVRRPLLRLHKALLDAERMAYEKEHGRIQGGGALLQLVIADPWFAWLRPMSGLIVMIDEYLEDAKRPPAEAVALA